MLDIIGTLLIFHLLVGYAFWELIVHTRHRHTILSNPHPLALSLIFLVLWPAILRRMAAGG